MKRHTSDTRLLAKDKMTPYLTLFGRVMGMCTFIALSLVLFGPVVYGQEQGKGQAFERSLTSSSVKQLSLPQVYVLFFRYQNHLDKVAQQRQSQGQDGSWLSDHFQRELGFTVSDFSVVRASGIRLESELDQINARAKALIQAEQAASAANANANDTRAPSPELVDLAKQRDESIQTEISKMNAELGPTAAAKLQNYLQTDFAPKITPANTHHLPINPNALQHRSQDGGAQP